MSLNGLVLVVAQPTRMLTAQVLVWITRVNVPAGHTMMCRARPAPDPFAAHEPSEEIRLPHRDTRGSKFRRIRQHQEQTLEVQPERHDFHGIVETRSPFVRLTIGPRDPSVVGPIPDALRPSVTAEPLHPFHRYLRPPKGAALGGSMAVTRHALQLGEFRNVNSAQVRCA